MLTHFQKRKLTRYFNILDVNLSGFLERSDFEEIGENLASLRNFEKGSDEYEGVMSAILTIWNNSRSFGEAKNPDEVSLEEWLKHEEKALETEEMIEQYMKKITRGVFDLVDENGDGTIQFREYAQILKAFRVEDGIAEFSFPKLDLNGDGVISKDEFVTVVEQFHLSQDRNAPGNYLFGPY